MLHKSYHLQSFSDPNAERSKSLIQMLQILEQRSFGRRCRHWPQFKHILKIWDLYFPERMCTSSRHQWKDMNGRKEVGRGWQSNLASLPLCKHVKYLYCNYGVMEWPLPLRRIQKCNQQYIRQSEKGCPSFICNTKATSDPLFRPGWESLDSAPLLLQIWASYCKLAWIGIRL